MDNESYTRKELLASKKGKIDSRDSTDLVVASHADVLRGSVQYRKRLVLGRSNRIKQRLVQFLQKKIDVFVNF